jgi:RHS repeat-associated protein
MTGRQLVFNYNTDNRLIKLDLPDGGALLFGYDPYANLQTVTYPDGKFTTYSYYPSTNAILRQALVGEQDEGGNPYSSTTYDAKGRATGTFLGSNRDSNTVVYTDSSDGSYASTAAITSPLGKTRTLTFQTVQGRVLPNGYVDSCTGCISKTQAFNYYPSGHVSSAADYASFVTTYMQDANGLETQRVEAASTPVQRKTQTIWNTSLRVPNERFVYDNADVLKAHETWTYNARGQALTHVELGANNPAQTRTTTYTYCDQIGGACPLVGLLTLVNGPRTDVTDTTAFAYYLSDDATCATAPLTCPHRKGDLFTVTNAKGQVTTYLKYDGAGRPLQISDANGVITDFTYLPRGWLQQIAVRGIDNASTADDAITTIDYEPYGEVKKITQPDGDFLTYTHDDAHRLTDVTDNLNRTIHYWLDNAGNRYQEDSKNSSGILKHTLSRVYDQLGRVQQLLNAAGQATLVTYDPNDNLDLVSDPINHTSDQDVDALNRVIKTTQDSAGLAVKTYYQYNALDEPTQVTDPKGLNTVYTYNGFGELITQVSPDTGTTSYTYNQVHNPASQTDARGVVTTYGYDALNRLTGVTYPTTALNVTYIYDTLNTACQPGESYPKGHLTQLTDSTGNTQFCYDRFGNLTRKVQVNGTLTQTTRFEYTMAGRLYRVTYPSGAQALYTRNAYDQITGVQLTIGGVASTLVSSVNYMPFGTFNSITFGNGRLQTLAYDLDYQPDLAYDSSTDGFGADYTVDAIGRIAHLGETFKGLTTTRDYTYDGLNRLTLATTPGATTLDERYIYDGTGDRQSKQIGATGVVLPYVYPNTSHQLSSMFGQPRSYDAAGNTTQIGPTGSNIGYAYDDRGRLTDVKSNGVTQRTYKYNGRGERVSKLYPLAPTNNLVFDYDEAGHLIGEYTSAGLSVAEYVWLDDTLVGIIKANDGTTYQYVESDYLGTPRVVIKPTTNTAVWHWDLTSRAFGETAPNGDPDGNGVSYTLNLRYPGQYYDDFGGMSYNYNRDYEAGTGRYAESDPIGLGGGISTYGYVEGNPLVGIDPNGLRDVNVYIWYAEGSSVGHVMVTEAASKNVILSQFPANGMPVGQNVTKSFAETMAAEGRAPSAVWSVNVPDDRAFDQAAARERGLARWSWSPSENTTQCSIAASRALQAGGVKITSVKTGTLMPGFFDNNLDENKQIPGNKIHRVHP